MVMPGRTETAFPGAQPLRHDVGESHERATADEQYVAGVDLHGFHFTMLAGPFHRHGGDGAFKDPVGKIWELADPVVSPGYTKGLEGTPNELKLKYLADHEFGDLSGEALQQAVAQKIREKDAKVSLVGNMVSEGTTPRHLTDLIGSLCDLTSGSGDKGTPIVYIQGYFDNYTND